MRVGYVRVSDPRQSTARQDGLMKLLNVERVYTDKCTGKHAERPQLKEMLDFIRDGDTLVIESISRLARSTVDLLRIVQTLTEKGVGFESQKEQIDTATPQGKFILTVFAALFELEREMIAERRDEGIAIAKAVGKYKGRKPIATDWQLFEKLYTRWKAGEITAVKMRKELGFGVQTFYRRVKEFESRKVS